MEQTNKYMSVEIPYEDTGIDELLDAFNGILIGFTWSQDTIYNCIADWLSEHAYDRFEVIEKLDVHEDD